MSRKLWMVMAVLLVAVIAVIGIILKERYAYKKGAKQPSNAYLYQRIKKYKIQGIDVSHHQGEIRWDQVKHPDSTQSLSFVFIRATVGTDTDKTFESNWNQAGIYKFTRGAYHYYWSDVNSTKQALHFIQNVKLKKGDLPPVLDIEDVSAVQDVLSLRKGLKNWIQMVEAHYGIRPILYTGDSFYRSYLKSDSYFENYPNIWIANYNNYQRPDADWDFWQYSDRLPVEGIQTLVDANVYRHDRKTFSQLVIQ